MAKLAIANIVRVPIKFEVNEQGKTKSFFFHLLCDRLSQDEIGERTKDPEKKLSEFVRGVTLGWEGQTLVLDEDDKPADFSLETFDLMFGLPNLALLAYNSYFKEVGAKAKN